MATNSGIFSFLSRCTGWTVLSSSGSLGCGPVEPLGGASGCLLSSPGGGERLVAVRHSPQSHASVFVGSRGRTTTATAAAAATAEATGEEEKEEDDDGGGAGTTPIAWDDLPDTFREVRLERMDGKNLLGKLELLMASLARGTDKAE